MNYLVPYVGRICLHLSEPPDFSSGRGDTSAPPLIIQHFCRYEKRENQKTRTFFHSLKIRHGFRRILHPCADFSRQKREKNRIFDKNAVFVTALCYDREKFLLRVRQIRRENRISK